MMEVTRSQSNEFISTPTRTKEIVRKHDFSMKKSLGQNFLTDQNMIRNIVAAAELDETKGALEIGPGIGALTEYLARAAGKVTAVEIDRRLVPILQETLAPYPNAVVIHEDILKTDLHQLMQEQFRGFGKVSVVANLPYYITTPIILKLLESNVPFEHIVVMIQKEVAERMTASPGTKDYGSLSIAIQYYCEAKLVMNVPRTVFIPQPNVDSAVMRLTLRQQPPVNVKDPDFFFQVVQAAFTQRRKTLYNNLVTRFFSKQQKEQLTDLLHRCGIEPSRRGETLSMQEFATLSEEIRKEMER
ncbi:16S rRNA (adenine(1518)-N(6)/adenine(1519)-N(6))-dimethyltransferase RsmA [Marinicrinis lubricantis]|uniref:Ribosomal RNA small subunit methyltransferase A n=1 Tax=Marinicrinis lubricantis TaxID=2086470 RepID=A0ABW1IRA0_9BACL